MGASSGKNRSDTIPFIGVTSFLCAVLVVALHLYPITAFVSDGAGAYFIKYLSHGAATAAVPTFFGISGFLFFRGVQSHKQIVNKLKKRLGSLVLPYIAWNCLYFVYYILTAKMPFRAQEKALDYSLQGILEAVFLHRYVFIMWFLLNLIILTYALSNLTFLLFRYKWLGRILCLITVIFGVCGLGSLSVPVGGSDVGLFTFSYGCYWFLGALIAIQKIRLPQIPKGVSMASFALYLLCGVFVFLSKDDLAFASFSSLFVFLNTLFFLVGIAGFVPHIRQPAQNMNMIIYGGHGFISVLFLYIAKRLLAPLAGGLSQAATVLCYFACIALIVVICYFGGALLKKILPPVYKVFAGSR